jgi:hypothetical protein
MAATMRGPSRCSKELDSSIPRSKETTGLSRYERQEFKDAEINDRGV